LRGGSLDDGVARMSASQAGEPPPVTGRSPAPLSRQKMSTEDKPEKPREDDFRETPEWHRARAKRLRKSGFTKMAQEHEQIAQMIESRRQQQSK
jgi:hypothetical protein